MAVNTCGRANINNIWSVRVLYCQLRLAFIVVLSIKDTRQLPPVFFIKYHNTDYTVVSFRN